MKDFYAGNYKRLMLAPIILLVPMLFVVLAYPGISMGTEFTGGNVIILRSSTPLSTSQIESVLSGKFQLTDLSVSTISSPTGYGAYIQYSKEPSTSLAEDFISKATASIENEQESIAFSNSALKALGKPEQQFQNAKAALNAAQDALASYNQGFYSKLQSALSEGLSLGSNVEFQTRTVSPTLGKASLESAALISIMGAIALLIIIFLSFRQVVPSAAIIQSMIFDVLGGLTGMALLGIPLSLLTVSTLLMVVGYSVDSNIMLTSRMLKGKGGRPSERATASMKTGLTMTGTTMAALIPMMAISYFYQMDLVFQIAAVLFFGQVGDVMATWFMNTSILLWFLERKEKRVAS
jgi:preprotein translocase subunit SecF